MSPSTDRGVRRVALVSLHTSPAAQPGTADAGGMNVVLLGLATELAARGVEVDLLTRAVGPPRVRELSPGVTLHELAAGGAGELPKEQLRSVTDEFGEAVAELARKSRYDVIHAHYWLSGIASLPVALELGVPFVQSFHTVAAMNKELVRESYLDLLCF
jgi:D-inositol-3-phosphate glycosyltransferase